MKFDVHIYTTVRVKVVGIEAETQIEAIKKATAGVDLHLLLQQNFDVQATDGARVEYYEYAEEITDYLVDQQGDDDYSKSRYYRPDDVDRDPSMRLEVICSECNKLCYADTAKAVLGNWIGTCCQGGRRAV